MTEFISQRVDQPQMGTDTHGYDLWMRLAGTLAPPPTNGLERYLKMSSRAFNCFRTGKALPQLINY
jgi:hypothetical protein